MSFVAHFSNEMFISIPQSSALCCPIEWSSRMTWRRRQHFSPKTR